jgi:ribosomal protein S17E
MVFSSPIQQWRHGQDARQVLRLIPNDASVSANTPLVPLIARREVAVRYPESLHYLDRDKNKRAVDWIAIDLNWLERYSVAFRSDWRELRRIKQELPDQMSDYRVQTIKNGIAVLQHDGPVKPALEKQLREMLATPLAPHPSRPPNKKS